VREEEEQEEKEEAGEAEEGYELEDAEETRIGDQVERTGKISPGGASTSTEKDGERDNAKDKPKADSINKPADPTYPNFVRWSPSTEIGDFIRDAARGTEFAVDIEGAPEPIYVGVPSFEDRTYYLRMRLRKTARRISELADVKNECDGLAQKGAQRVAQTGFGALLGWWGAVYYLTCVFHLPTYHDVQVAETQVGRF